MRARARRLVPCWCGAGPAGRAEIIDRSAVGRPACPVASRAPLPLRSGAILINSSPTLATTCSATTRQDLPTTGWLPPARRSGGRRKPSSGARQTGRQAKPAHSPGLSCGAWAGSQPRGRPDALAIERTSPAGGGAPPRPAPDWRESRISSARPPPLRLSCKGAGGGLCGSNN